MSSKIQTICMNFLERLSVQGKCNVIDNHKELCSSDIQPRGWMTQSTPEEFTKQYLVEPILHHLGFELNREGKHCIKGQYRRVDYEGIVNGSPVIIEVKPFNKPLNRKDGMGKSAKDQVKDILTAKQIGNRYACGIATNGNDWCIINHNGHELCNKNLFRDKNCLDEVMNYIGKCDGEKILFFSHTNNEIHLKRLMRKFPSELNPKISISTVLPIKYRTYQKDVKKLGSGFKENEGIYVISNAKVKSLKLNVSETKVLRKIYTQDKLQPYFPKTTSKYLIFADSKGSATIQKYTNLRAHLDRYKPILGKRKDPYAIPKLTPDYCSGIRFVCPIISKYPMFSILKDGECATGFIIIKPAKTIDAYYLLGLLNSSVIKSMCLIAWTEGNFEISTEIFKKIPFLNGTPEQVKEISTLTKKIVTSRKVNKESVDRINEIVFSIYGMSPKDIRVVKQIEKGIEKKYNEINNIIMRERSC